MGIIVLGGGWFLATQSREVKRIDILLNKTREEIARDYVTKNESRAVMKDLVDRLDKLDEKLDKLFELR